MRLRYVAIDCETSGLNPLTCQVLEFAAVAETDWVAPVESLPRLHFLVEHAEVRGEPAALAMNARLLAELASPAAERSLATCPAFGVGAAFEKFLDAHFGTESRVTVAGKNVAGFDLRFLGNLLAWPADRIRHRVIDPGALWFDPSSDDHVPDTAECLRRAGLFNDHPHHALYDCFATIGLVREAVWRRLPSPRKEAA